MKILKRTLPINFTKGRGGHKVKGIVLHLMGGTLKGTDSWFRNPSAQASTHYGIGKKGEIYQWVEETDTAYGNGRIYKPTWRLIDTKINPNLYTISIEHEGVSGHTWTEEQYAADVELIKAIAARWNIPLDRDHIIIHSEIYALKPACAGPGLDLNKLMSMLVPPVASVKNALVKGDASPAVFWVDDNSKKHALPNWEFYLEFFGGDIKVLPQKTVDNLSVGLPFSVKK